MEEALVDLPTDAVRRGPVLPVALGGDAERLIEQFVGVGEVPVGDLDLALCGCHGAGQPVHLTLEDVGGYGPVVVSSHQGCALASELVQLLVGPLGLAVRLGDPSRHLGVHGELEVDDRRLGELDTGVQPQDAVLDALDPDGLLGAVDLVVVALRAHEVVVGDAAASNVAAEDEALAALAAEDCAA